MLTGRLPKDRTCAQKKSRQPKRGGGLCIRARAYQAKWAKALLASAMRCTFSRLVIAVPSLL